MLSRIACHRCAVPVSPRALGAAWQLAGIALRSWAWDARTPGGPFGWQRLRSRWLVSLAGLELQVLRGRGLGGVAGRNPVEAGWPGRMQFDL
ncbi:MAG: hypothetical protein WAW52_03230 [Methanothrix sp.]